MKTFTTLLLATMLCAPAWASGCTPLCYMFAAVAMARLCPNLTLIRTPENDANLKETFDGSRESRQFMADALRMMQRNIISDPKHACHLTEEDCGAAGDDPEHGGTVCQYIKEK